MENAGRQKVLVIGAEQDFRNLVAGLLQGRFAVVAASTEAEGLAAARRERPTAIVLGYLEPRGASFNLHRRLKAGWITKHIPLLVIDVQVPGQPDRSWTPEEAMQMQAEDYLVMAPDDVTSLARLAESVGLIERIRRTLHEKANPLEEAILDPQAFCVTWEQIPGRGAFEIQQETILDNVGKAAEGGKVQAISVTDNPGGNPALSTEMLCAEIKKSGMEPLVHLACRDKNRSEIESMLYGLASAGVRNVLILTGDYPSAEGFAGRPKPVFDVDPVNVLRMIELMNRGLEHSVAGKTITLAPTDIFAGVCISPFKKLEAELVGQYFKLKKKIRAGAKFVITQVGYDVRKLHELLQWLRLSGYNIPVFANIYVLPYGVAKTFNANAVPGCVVTGKLLSELAREAKAEDRGREARLLRAAKQFAIAKGLGCAGAHIGGHGVSYEMVEYIIDKGGELAENWRDLTAEFEYPQEKGFYFFEQDLATGLNSPVRSARNPRPRAALQYRMMRLLHALIFEREKPWFPTIQRIMQRIDSSDRLRKAFKFLEHAAKVVLFECMNCGDCALFDVAYLCPMSQCPKEQRNGPCGGSYKGWCEVHPNEKKCVWVRAYRRLKAYGEENEIAENLVPPCNWELRQTPSWLNFYLGRDHTAKRLGIKPPAQKATVSRGVG